MLVVGRHRQLCWPPGQTTHFIVLKVEVGISHFVVLKVEVGITHFVVLKVEVGIPHFAVLSRRNE